jgi:hypothetical protein
MLREFEYSESEIRILKVIRSRDHAVVYLYRIATGGRTPALKVVSFSHIILDQAVCLINNHQHKYNDEAISKLCTPKPNIFFETE